MGIIAIAPKQKNRTDGHRKVVLYGFVNRYESCSAMNQDFPNTHTPQYILYYLNSMSRTISLTRILLTISNTNHLVAARPEGDYPFEKIPIYRIGLPDVRSRDCRHVPPVSALDRLFSADWLFLGPQFGPFAPKIHRIGKIQTVHRRSVSKEKHHEPGNDPDVRDDALCLCDPFCADRQRIVAHRTDNRILGPPDRIDLAFAVQKITTLPVSRLALSAWSFSSRTRFEMTSRISWGRTS